MMVLNYTLCVGCNFAQKRNITKQFYYLRKETLFFHNIFHRAKLWQIATCLWLLCFCAASSQYVQALLMSSIFCLRRLVLLLCCKRAKKENILTMLANLVRLQSSLNWSSQLIVAGDRGKIKDVKLCTTRQKTILVPPRYSDSL